MIKLIIETNRESLSDQNNDQSLLKHQDNTKDYTSETTKLVAQTPWLRSVISWRQFLLVMSIYAFNKSGPL